MNYVSILIGIVAIIIIFTCAYSKSITEGLTTSDNVVFIGDSVLNNSKYVGEKKSVFEILKTKIQNVYNFAQDGATITDCYSQLDKISSDLNSSNTFIFISVGGNNILNERNQMTTEAVKELFNKLLEFIRSVKSKLPNVKINVFNMYQPTNPRYKTYKSIIDQWNRLIEENTGKVGTLYNVIDLHSLLNNSNDFVYEIEPSEDASKKIANIIYLTR
jgi:lysophospholipase L1-like esterase